MKIAIFGVGYVGAVSCGCLAKLGHDVIAVDVNAEKLARINSGKSPVMEPGLDKLIYEGVSANKICATGDVAEAVNNTDLAIVSVGTPSTATGGTNTTQLMAVFSQIAQVLNSSEKKLYSVLNRSTCSVSTHRQLQQILQQDKARVGLKVGYACHPEFLRECSAIDDFFHPPKIVFGTSDRVTEDTCRRLYTGIAAPTFYVSPEVAALVKYADNCFHAVKVTFANEIGMIARSEKVDSRKVMEIFCADTKLNISARYLRPGAPFGGSCLPKDLRALLDCGRQTATPLQMLQGAVTSNRSQIDELLLRLMPCASKSVGFVGISFKEGTDDVRESPSVHLMETLLGRGITLSVYDAYLSTEQLIGSNKSFALNSIPHLSRYLVSSLEELFDTVSTVVVTHRLSSSDWKELVVPANVRIIDLVGVPELETHPNYEGVYW